MQVAIIGAGEIGKAIAHTLRSKTTCNVQLWDVNTDKVEDQRPLPEIVSEANIVFLCVPSSSIFGAARSIREHVRPTAPVVILTKGVERETCRMTDTLLDDVLGEHPWALLSGPMIAEEMLQDRAAAAVVGTRSDTTYKTIADCFSGTRLTLEHSKDVRSVALAGVLKNIYAVTLGMIEGLGDGDNVRGIFFTKAIAEMAHIMKHLGTSPEVAYGMAGLGDLVATATSPYSRNRTVGEEMATGHKQRMESEGLNALPCIPELLGDALPAFPILGSLYDVVSGKQPPSRLMEIITAQNSA